MSGRESVLIVDDDAAQAETLARVLRLEGYTARVANSGPSAMGLLGQGPCDLLLTDLKMPGMDGMELFRRVRAAHPSVPVLILTAHGTIDTAIEAVREGVDDFLQKPVYADELIHRFRAVLARRALQTENAELKRRLLHRERGDALIGTSPAMLRLREQIARVGRTEASVLVLGESGSGKELVADALHYASARASGPLVKLNCAAIPETLLEDEMFGHERGAFTGAQARRAGRFEQAHEGTLFLDEIGEMPPPLQAKLLRVLQDHAFQRLGGSEPLRADVRVICATHQDLPARVQEGRFREDLFYRINVVPLTIPPLRERGDDLLLLARHFAREAGERNGRAIESIDAAAADRLRRHSWPGNVRELRNVIERGVIMGSGAVLAEGDLALPEPAAAPAAAATDDSRLVDRLMNSEIPFEQFERELLVRALRRTGGNQTRAARLLGMTRRTLQYRIDKFSIDTAKLRDS